MTFGRWIKVCIRNTQKFLEIQYICICVCDLQARKRHLGGDKGATFQNKAKMTLIGVEFLLFRVAWMNKLLSIKGSQSWLATTPTEGRGWNSCHPRDTNHSDGSSLHCRSQAPKLVFKYWGVDLSSPYFAHGSSVFCLRLDSL